MTKRDINQLTDKEFQELAKPTGHVTGVPSEFIKDPIERAEALNQLTQEAQANGEYDTEPTVRLDGEAVITVANLQKLINSLIFKLLSSSN